MNSVMPKKKVFKPFSVSQVFRDRITTKFNFLQYYTQTILKSNIATKIFTHNDMQLSSLLTY